VSLEGLPAVASRANRGAEEARLAGRQVRYLTSLLFERDDVLFSLFLAHSEGDVLDAALRGGMPVDRISESLTDLCLSVVPGSPEVPAP